MRTGILLFCCLLLLSPHARAQDSGADSSHAGYAPVISGSMGYVYIVQGGIPSLEPQINPVLLLPLGSHVLFETRTDFTGFFERRQGTSGDYTGEIYKTVDFAQLDWLANSHVIPVAGLYILPFGIYAERLDPLWIANLQDLPIDYSIGTQTSGTGLGPQLRGVAVETNNFNLQYTAYYSVHSNVTQFQASLTAGGDASIYFTGLHAEFGTSYQRFLDNRQINSAAGYVTWQPPHTALDIKAEYDASYNGQGYWIEGNSMLSSIPFANSFFRRMQVVGRDEWFLPRHGGGNGVPNVETKRGEAGLNYYIGDDWRLISSYGREFKSSKNVNLWNLGFTYRFLWPLRREKK
jgi:hypothetical protein